jgi:RNA polymerase II-associated protein 1
LERCWPYGLLNILLSNFENLQEASTQQSELPEDEIIQVTLQFTELLEANCIRLASPTEQLVYLMMAYLGPNTKFLEPDVKQLIGRRVEALKTSIGSGKFNLNIKIEDGKKSFESFYSLFLDQFQSSSYGDDLFSVLVMIPLAQKYDVKWRARVWSEFVAVVRFLTCQEDQVFGGVDDYLTPAEREESVVQSYALAMNSNLVRIGSLPHKIATHHVECFKATAGHKTGAP